MIVNDLAAHGNTAEVDASAGVAKTSGSARGASMKTAMTAAMFVCLGVGTLSVIEQPAKAQLQCLGGTCNPFGFDNCYNPTPGQGNCGCHWTGFNDLWQCFGNS